MPPISGQSPDAGDKICIDRETFKQLRLLVGCCVDELVNPRDCEIFLTSLDIYLSKSDNPEPRKSLLLLNHYRDVVPDTLLEIAEYLEEATELINVVFAASQLGGNCD